ncbi:MAG: hypothetical protein HW412_1184 [Bacteroidetes bacterium]|nr:hypothetical protein [Bacteroidota bacterium]
MKYISPVLARVVGIAIITIVGILDDMTGPSISFSLFYLIPIAFVSWYGGISFGIFCSVLSTGLAMWEGLIWQPDLSPVVHGWNTLARLMNFTGVAFVFNYIHKLYLGGVKQVEDKYTRIVESVIEGIIAADTDGRIKFVNARAVHILGYPESFISGRSVLTFIKDESSRKKMSALLVRWKPTPSPIEIQFVHKNGGPLWALVNANVSQGENGAIDGVVLLITDISERKRAEQALRESEQSYRILVERMNEGLLKVDEEDRIQFVNDAFCAIVGYARGELIGRVASEVFLSAEGAELISEKHALRRQGIADTYELRLTKKSGELIWARVSGAPVMDGVGNVVGSIGVHTDITMQKEADEELLRRYEMISAMQHLSSVLVQSLHLNRRLEAALNTVTDVMKFDGGTIFMFDEGRKELVLQHQRGLPNAVVERIRRWPVGVGVIGRVAVTATAAFIEDARDEPEIDQKIREMAGLSGIAHVPLESKAEVLGVMTLFYHHPHKFTENERLMLQTFGKQIGIALENARLYETARERERENRLLSIELVKVQEDERRRFARELHDGLSQVLTTLKIKTELVTKNFHSDPAEAERHLKDVLTLADEAQAETKQVAYDLRPAILDDFGLKAAIAALASGFERGTGVATEFIAPIPDVRFESLLESSVYRIVQELLANVAKHAAATRISIQMLMREDTLVIEVADNGRGFDSSKDGVAAHAGPHFGLRNIRERVEFFGGSFRTESHQGRGMEVMIELPVANMMLPLHKQATGT